MEEVEIEVWWPKDTGPFRHRAPEKRQTRAAKPPRREEGPRPPRSVTSAMKRKPRREDRKPAFEERKPRPEKPVDPNSPFAVLGALKAKLAGK